VSGARRYWLGDAVMTTPALQRLRERLHDAHITLLTHEKLAAFGSTTQALMRCHVLPGEPVLWLAASVCELPDTAGAANSVRSPGSLVGAHPAPRRLRPAWGVCLSRIQSVTPRSNLHA